MRHFLPLTSLFILLILPTISSAEIEDQYGIGLYGASSYSSDSDLNFVQASFIGIWDYDSIWPYTVPDNLAFKVEALAGATLEDGRLITSLNMYATYYFGMFKTERFSPYFDAGIGVIYTDFQEEGQGLRWNFNPQLGIGTEYTTDSGSTWFTGIRLHHISNGGLDDDNTGVNSVALTFGKYF